MITIGSTPLLRAAKAFDVDAIKLLIEGGALVNLPNNAGYTPVMASVAADLDLTQTQVDALCDFVFNVGASNFRSSSLLRAINNSEFHRVPDQFRRWVYADGQKLRGLQKRREHEIALFMEGVSVTRGPVPADEDLSPVDIRSGEGAAE